MSLQSKKIPLFVLGVTALLCSRTMFWFFGDPEGPNLLIVVVAAVGIYVLALVMYARAPLFKGSFDRLPLGSLVYPMRLLLVVCIQICIATAFYFLGSAV